jgi:amino acid transporter
MRSYTVASERAGVGGWIPVVALLVAVGHLGKVGAWFAASGRLPFVAGLDQRLPAMFGRLHTRWGSPYVALLVQAAVVAVLILLGQAGTSTEGAYQVYLSITLIPTFIPFLYLFAAAMKGHGSGVKQSSVRWIAAVGFLTTTSAMALAVVPPDNEPDPRLYVIKVVGLAVVVVGAGALLYFLAPAGTGRPVRSLQ